MIVADNPGTLFDPVGPPLTPVNQALRCYNPADDPDGTAIPGRPVAGASRRVVCGTNTIAKHDVNSVVLRSGQADDIAEALMELLADADKRRRLGEVAYRYAMERFQSWDERMKMEVRALRELLA